jgi:hypothetical protein
MMIVGFVGLGLVAGYRRRTEGWRRVLSTLEAFKSSIRPLALSKIGRPAVGAISAMSWR